MVKPLRYRDIVVSRKMQLDVITSMTGPARESGRRLARYVLSDIAPNKRECDRIISRIMQAARRRGEVIAKGHRWYRIARDENNV